MQRLNKLHFFRFEFKYVFNKRLRDEVERELQYFMELDPFVKDKPDYRYFVRSLYFDDPFFSAYYDKIDGLHTRSKFRLRTYTKNIGSPVPLFFEIKGRYNNLVFKHRVLCNLNEQHTSMGGMRLAQKMACILDPTPIAEQFRYEFYRKRLEPVVLVDYWRRPYVSKYNPEFRLTFDEALRATATSRLFPPALPPGRSIGPGFTIMEVKFRYHIPSWFHRIIQHFELQRVSISKVCKGIEACGLAKNLE